MRSPLQLVVMGVSGSGKSTVAVLIGERLGCEVAEGDDFHSPENVAKMAAGQPLTDEDRLPWLRAIAAWLAERARAGVPAIITCSALKRSYRDLLREAAPRLAFLHLSGDRALIADRIEARSGHFMPVQLLDSQYAALEPLEADERGLTLDVARTPDELADAALDGLNQPAGG